VNAVLWAGVYVGLVNTGIITIFNLSATVSGDAANIGMLILEGILNGIFSAGLALIGLFAIGSLFGITTSIQLLDLGRPTQPLLRQLLLKASGTYHHSLMVSNLAEQAAERIGADSLLVRVMAYYHDIGKMQRPYFFIENQPEGMTNVHEKLDPQISAQIIISHVTDGLDLANKYRLPQALKDGIAQHQGTGLVRFFYYQAVEAAKERGGEVDEAKFRYPGPKPQTKETGILMLADVSETTVRALKPRSAAEIDEIVQKAIAHHLDTGQLDECDLTIADLHKIRSAFVDILQGVHHPRIKYPEQVKEEAEKKQATAAKEGQADEQPPSTASPKPVKSVPPATPASLVQRE
jgi:putative nucleotidyltransferase with HDIG domain